MNVFTIIIIIVYPVLWYMLSLIKRLKKFFPTDMPFIFAVIYTFGFLFSLSTYPDYKSKSLITAGAFFVGFILWFLIRFEMKRFLLVLLIFSLALPACQRQTERELNRLDFIIQDLLKTTFSLETWEKPKNSDQESQKQDIVSLLDVYPGVDVPSPQLITDGYFFALYYERKSKPVEKMYIMFVNHGGDRLIGYMSNVPVLHGSLLKGMSHISLMEKVSCRNFKDDIEEYRIYQREYNFRRFDIEGIPTWALTDVMALAEYSLEKAIALEDESGTIRHVR